MYQIACEDQQHKAALSEGPDIISQGHLPGVNAPCVWRHVARNTGAWIQLCQWLEGGRAGSCTARGLSPPLLCLLGADSGEDCPISVISHILHKPVLAGADRHTKTSLTSMQSTIHIARRLSLSALLQNSCLGFPRRGHAGGEQSGATLHPQCIPDGSPGQVIRGAGLQRLQINRNELKPETPSSLPGLTWALVWNRKAFATRCCLPKMDQSLNKSYLADLALGDAHNAFLKLLWTHSLIVSSCEQDREDSIK